MDHLAIEKCQMNNVHLKNCSSAEGLKFINNVVINALFDRGIYVKGIFKECRFDDASLPNVSIKESQIIDCNFSNTYWKSGTFYKSKFNDCSFDKAKFLDFYLNETGFSKCTLRSIDFTEVSEMIGIGIRESDLTECILESKNLGKFNNPDSCIQENNFTNAKLNKTSFTKQQMYNSVFDGAELNETSFGLCNLIGASFKAANGFKPEFNEAKLYNAIFNDAVLRGGFWDGAHASRAIFIRTDLSGSSLQHSDFSNASMHQAKIESVLFGGCNLSGVAYPSGGVCEPGSIGQCIINGHPHKGNETD